MSTFPYPKLVGVSNKLLSLFGQATQYRRTVTGEYDPVTGTTPTTTTLYDVTAVAFDVDNKLIDGTLIRVGDKQVYSTPNFKPEVGDEYPVDGVWWKVVLPIETKPAETAVLQQCIIRGR